MVAILIVSAKLATLGPVEIKTFWNKAYDAIISVHDVTNKIISNCIEDVVMWPKFANSSISVREFIKTSIL